MSGARWALWLALVGAADGCGNAHAREAAALTGGDPSRGEERIREAGCGSCHVIPGVRGAVGVVGPSLEHVASRYYLAGRLPNTPVNMLHWVRHPQEQIPGNAMPETGLTPQSARDVAAYLYTLR